MNTRLRTKVWFEVNGEFAIGQGGLDLLAAIVSTGSITRAARDIGWSYRHAWGYIRNAEKVLTMALIEARPGKGRSRGTILTESGRILFAQLSAERDRIERAAQSSEERFSGGNREVATR
jgi:molybdate transport system regulatory protein